MQFLQDIVDSYNLNEEQLNGAALRISALEHNLNEGLCTEEGAIEAITDFCKTSTETMQDKG